MMQFAAGQSVTWWWTAGGGGGSGKRQNPKEARPAVVVQVGPRRVKIRVLDRSEGVNETWVDPKNLGPAHPDVRLEKPTTFLIATQGRVCMRIAILYDDAGKVIFRGPPALLPVRFVSDSGEVHQWTMQQAVDAGTPIDEQTGDDLAIHPDDQ